MEGGGSGRCEKPENSQEVTFLRPTPQPAFKEVATQETGDLWFYIHFENMNIFYNWGGRRLSLFGKVGLGFGSRSSFVPIFLSIQWSKHF